MTSNAPSDRDDISRGVIGAAIEVHRELGPGLLERAYEPCLACEFQFREIEAERQVALPIRYKGHRFDCGYRLDFVVEDTVIVELKSVQSLEPIHRAQTLSYLRHSEAELALLINFGERLLKDGLERIVDDRSR